MDIADFYRKNPSVKNIDETHKILFVKFIEQGAWILHLSTILFAQKQLGKENVFICTFKSNQAFIQTLDFIEEKQVFYIDNSNLFRFIVSYLLNILRIRKQVIMKSKEATKAFSVMVNINTMQ